MASTTITTPAIIAIFAPLERLLLWGGGNCGAFGAPARPALASATILRTSDFTFSFLAVAGAVEVAAVVPVYAFAPADCAITLAEKQTRGHTQAKIFSL
jgi:hypothetical protein